MANKKKRGEYTPNAELTEIQRRNRTNNRMGLKTESKIATFLKEFGFNRIYSSGSRNLPDVENDDFACEVKLITPKEDRNGLLYILFDKKFIHKHIERAKRMNKTPIWFFKMRSSRIKDYYVILRGDDFIFHNAIDEYEFWIDNESSWKIYHPVYRSGRDANAKLYQILKHKCELGTFYIMDMRLFKLLLDYKYNGNLLKDVSDNKIYETTGSYYEGYRNGIGEIKETQKSKEMKPHGTAKKNNNN